MKIDSYYEVLDTLQTNFDDKEIKNETMLFNNDVEGAWNNGDRITRCFLNMLPQDWFNAPLVIDSRVHMLMPGWYPCIPGWHHDDVPRERSDGQPEYEKPTDRAEHIMMLVNAHLAPTEFALGSAAFDIPPIGSVIYEEWHSEVNLAIKAQELIVQSAPDKTLVKFNDRTWHRGVAATGNGWRFFIRASRYFNKDGEPIPRRNARTNEVRKQVQVYMSAENAGW